MNRKKYPVVNIGTTSLLTIFVILCMVTFAALSWLTAVRNARLNERVQERTEAWYQAANAAYEKIAEEYSDRLVAAKVNIDEEAQLAEEAQVEVIPTLVLYKNGTAVASVVNPGSKAAIDQFIQEALEK